MVSSEGTVEASGLSKALSLYSAYSWRGRIGLIVPSTNTTLEPEFARMAPEGVGVYASRVYQVGPQEPSSYHRMAEDIETAAAMLATSEIDVIAFGCTSCTYFVSPDVVKATMQKAARCTAILTADAVVDALRVLKVKSIGVVGPRTKMVTDREVKFLQDAGFQVAAVKSLGLGTNEEERRSIGRVPPQVVYSLASSIARPEIEAFFVSCTQLATLNMIATLEQSLGKPVITSNQALMWRSLRMLNFREPIAGFGRLLSENPDPAMVSP
jgi:maleate isomerase